MVGKATVPKLHKLIIFTIGDLANYDINIFKEKLKSHGVMIWNYANGIENTPVVKENYTKMKGLGNSSTAAFDITDRKKAYAFLLAFSETIGMRLRNLNNSCKVIAVHIREINFSNH